MNSELAPYARAVFNVSLAAGNTQHWIDKLSEISQELAKSATLNFIKSPEVSSKQKAEILHQAIQKAGYDAEVARFVKYIAVNNKIEYLSDIVAILQAEHDKKEGIQRVNIVQARELPGDYKDKITKWLAARIAGTIVPTWSLDADLIGGFVVEVKDTVYDYSVRARINQIKESLM